VTAPVVKILREASGMPCLDGRRIDLAHQDVQRSHPSFVSIAEAVHPENVDVRPEELVE